MSVTKPSRRDLFRLSGGALALNYAPSFAKAEDASTHLSGRVTDAQTGEGLPNIRVSNGRDIVITDAQGAYSLPSHGSAHAFVIKPSGWAAPVDQTNMLPQIHHAPGSSKPMDFSLRRTLEDEAFEVIMFADPQPANDLELGYLRAQLANGPIGSGAAFGITLGDLVGDNLSLFERYNQIISQIGVPWWNLPGNHDLDFSAASQAGARAPWRKAFGPTTYAFEYGAATFIMHDNIHWHGDAAGANLYSGRIGDDNLAFVEALLRTVPRDRLIVLCMHIPLISTSDPADAGSNTTDRDALLALLEDRPCVSFSGHMHTTEHHYLPLPGGAHHHHHILTALSGSWWSGPMDPLGQPMAQSCDGSPNGWHILSITGNTCSTRFVAAREQTQMRIMLTSRGVDQPSAEAALSRANVISSAQIGDTRVVVNVFDGGPHTVVEACVSGCAPSNMKRAYRPDPVTRDLFQQAGKTKKPWVRAEPSSHIWEASLPADLSPGFHRLNVTATNEYGHIHRSALIFEVSTG